MMSEVDVNADISVLQSIPGPSSLSNEALVAALALATQNNNLPLFSQNGSANSLLPSQVNQTPGVEANEMSSGQEVVPSVSSLDEETLKLLGDDPEKDESEKFSLQQDLAQRWKGWISSGLKKDMLEELLKKYGRSGNCPLDAPMLNPEIMASLSEVTTKRDKHFVQSQKMIGSAMVALGTAITMLLVNNDEGIDRLQLIENLCDAGKLLAATHYKESLARRAFISPGISKPLRTTLDNSKPEVFLYGSDLQAKIKEAKSIVRVGDDLKVKIAQKQSVEKLPNKNLNFKGPPAKQRNFSSVGNRQQSQFRRRFQSRSQSTPQGKENRERSDKRPPSRR